MLKFLSVEVYILYPSILTCFPLYLKSFFFFLYFHRVFARSRALLSTSTKTVYTSQILS